MKKTLIFSLLIAVIIASPMAATAGMKMKISEDTDIDLGFRVQSLFRATDNDGGNTGDSVEDFLVRRARFRLGGNVTQWVSFFLQTEAASESGTGLDMRLIDAFATLNLHPLAKIYLGENMAPAGRQITTSSGGLMAMDRPNINSYNLTWGLNGRIQFNTATFPDGNVGLNGQTNVRDEGATLFGKHSFTDEVHVKYYVGVYDGIQEAGSDKERYTGRIQFNFFDPEPGYYNLSTYLGKKKTIGIGASYDTQDNIAEDAIMGKIDYRWWSVDAFADWPLGPGSITLEGGYINLDLDDATQMDDGGAAPRDARQTQGDGWYTQAGYLIKDWNLQPWFAYGNWDTDAADDRGSFSYGQVGLTYFFKGHNANIKAGYEFFNAEEDIGTSDQDDIGTFLIGFYVTF